MATKEEQGDQYLAALCEWNKNIKNLMKTVEWKGQSTEKGLDFLEMKKDIMLDYLANLIKYSCMKAQGLSIQGSEPVKRLIEDRVYLEKIRPLEDKLKYQIDKYVKISQTGGRDKNDPLRLKPNPQNLESTLDDEDDEGSSEEEGSDADGAAASKVYKPPKIAAMHYDGDETFKEKQEKLLEKKKKRALSSSIMRDLKAEYDEGPTELKDDANLHRAKADKAGKEREDYEEKYMMRMQVSKKEKNAAKRLRTMGDINSITHFGSIGALTGEADDMDLPRKKRKTMSSKKKKGGKKKKFRH